MINRHYAAVKYIVFGIVRAVWYTFLGEWHTISVGVIV